MRSLTLNALPLVEVLTRPSVTRFVPVMVFISHLLAAALVQRLQG